MTSKASMNALLVAAGVAAASAIWAAAIFLPAPSDGKPMAIAELRPALAPAAPGMAAEPFAPIAQEQAPPAPDAAAQEAPVTPPALASASPAAFGSLPSFMSSATPPLRASLLDNVAPLALASTSIQSIGATFANPPSLPGLPDFGGAAQLDGPADTGLDEPVVQAALPDPRAPAPTGRIIVIDASEGTKLDPLRQKNWDLNAVQVIPSSVMAPPKR
ncbi:MAG: hypothetical protein ACK4MV_13935 [Beijerinckiaceae bacterium]